MKRRPAPLGVRRTSALTCTALTAVALGCQDGQPVGPATSMIPAAQAATVSLTATLANGQATGCIRSANGTLYDFAPGGTPSKPCKAGDVQITIGQVEQEPTTGILGAELVTDDGTVGAGFQNSVFVDCPAGKVPLAGGFEKGVGLELIASAPFNPTSGVFSWYVSAYNPGTVTRGFQAFTLCVEATLAE